MLRRVYTKKLLQKVSVPSSVVQCQEAEYLTDSEKRTIKVFRECSPSVVHINTQLDVPTNWFTMTRIHSGASSGFVWDTEGHIVTNYHVIRNATHASVTLLDHTVLDAELVGVEPDVDVAVLRVKFKTPAPPVVLGDSSALQVGQKVYAIGNPFGLDLSLSEGVVSGVGRQIEGIGGRVIRNLIQTDAAINPGNSGGPLLDGQGHCVGINTMIASANGTWTGIGFAVPSSTVARTVNQIIKYGHTIRPWLGLSLAPIILRSGLFSQKTVSGVSVISVQKKSPADLAGIQATKFQGGRIVLGDIILKLDGVDISDPEQVSDMVEAKKAGESVTLTIRRNDEDLEIKIVLSDRPATIPQEIPFESIRSRL